jgi:hypothetical protein
MDWSTLAVIAAVCSAAAAIGRGVDAGIVRVFGLGKHAGATNAQMGATNAIANEALASIKIVHEQLHKHELSDAAAFAEMRASLAALSRDQVGVENRIAGMIDALRDDIRDGAQDRAKAIEGVRRELGGVNDRIDRILSERSV